MLGRWLKAIFALFAAPQVEVLIKGPHGFVLIKSEDGTYSVPKFPDDGLLPLNVYKLATTTKLDLRRFRYGVYYRGFCRRKVYFLTETKGFDGFVLSSNLSLLDDNTLSDIISGVDQ